MISDVPTRYHDDLQNRADQNGARLYCWSWSNRNRGHQFRSYQIEGINESEPDHRSQDYR